MTIVTNRECLRLSIHIYIYKHCDDNHNYIERSHKNICANFIRHSRKTVAIKRDQKTKSNYEKKVKQSKETERKRKNYEQLIV